MRLRHLSRAELAAALAPYLLVAVVAAITAAMLVTRPGEAGVAPVADQVIVVGATGLRWDDVDPQGTPQLWSLAAEGAIGSLSARSAHTPTCAADGWLTLGAGNWAADRAGGRVHGGDTGPPEEPCPPLSVEVERDSAVGAQLPEQEALVRYNQWELPWGAVPGALAGSVDCTSAFGPGAAVAAARSFGRVDRYAPAFPDDPDSAVDALAGRCELAIVDLGTVAGTGARRVAAAQRVDAALGEVLAARPAGALVLVAGVADSADTPRLHVAVAHGPGPGSGPGSGLGTDGASGWLTSATTGRAGYLQLVDIAPTVLAALGRPAPEVDLSGSPVTSRPGRPADPAEAVAQLVATDRVAQQARPVATWFLAVLTVAHLALLAAVVPLLRRPERARRALAPPGPGPGLLVAAGLAIPAALVAGAVPWWRASSAGGAFAVATLAVLAAAAVLGASAPAVRRPLGLVGGAAAVAAAVVVADLVTGSSLQLNGVVGYSAQEGDRYAGLGGIGLGVLIAGTLLVAGCLAEQVPRRRRPLVVVLVGAPGVVVAGSPYLGADIGGAVALVVGVCLAAALCTGGWLIPRRMGWAVLAGLLVVAVVAGFDLRRPPEQRTGLGSMLTQLADGTAGFGIQRVSLANAEALTSTPLTVLAVGAGAFLWLVLLRPWGGLRRVFGVHPALRAGAAGAAAASLLAGILTGEALTVAAATAAVAVPLLTLAALRQRAQSAGATPVARSPDGSPDVLAATGPAGPSG